VKTKNMASDDDKKHLLADDRDESGENSTLAEDLDNKPLDIDEARKEMNEPNDDAGPNPVDSGIDIVDTEE
jgi:hypothetical protein